MRKPITDIALLAYIAKRNTDVVSYTEATKACKSSSSASRALHQLIEEGLIEPKPKLIGLRYVTQYAVTPRGKQVSKLALQLVELRETASKMKKSEEEEEISEPETTLEEPIAIEAKAKPAQAVGKKTGRKKEAKK